MGRASPRRATQELVPLIVLDHGAVGPVAVEAQRHVHILCQLLQRTEGQAALRATERASHRIATRMCVQWTALGLGGAGDLAPRRAVEARRLERTQFRQRKLGLAVHVQRVPVPVSRRRATQPHAQWTVLGLGGAGDLAPRRAVEARRLERTQFRQRKLGLAVHVQRVPVPVSRRRATQPHAQWTVLGLGGAGDLALQRAAEARSLGRTLCQPLRRMAVRPAARVPVPVSHRRATHSHVLLTVLGLGGAGDLALLHRVRSRARTL